MLSGLHNGPSTSLSPLSSGSGNELFAPIVTSSGYSFKIRVSGTCEPATAIGVEGQSSTHDVCTPGIQRIFPSRDGSPSPDVGCSAQRPEGAAWSNPPSVWQQGTDRDDDNIFAAAAPPAWCDAHPLADCEQFEGGAQGFPIASLAEHATHDTEHPLSRPNRPVLPTGCHAVIGINVVEQRATLLSGVLPTVITNTEVEDMKEVGCWTMQDGTLVIWCEDGFWKETKPYTDAEATAHNINVSSKYTIATRDELFAILCGFVLGLQRAGLGTISVCPEAGDAGIGESVQAWIEKGAMEQSEDIRPPSAAN
eukprot:TRINITY_DN67197_c3_g3_i3.p1 TRINITY_DN67197_c3_g3~~TRINITY_DN67197_c3_g3_i3.p1  ORF type:complete len:309 (-),score=15.00 TRINITY_DN67197_c3_g3_i3:104-1030(-)